MSEHVTEVQAVTSIVQQYVDAARSGDIEALGQPFHPVAQMYGFLNGAPANMPISQFLEMARGFPAPAVSGEPYATVVASVTVSGSAAVATLHETSYLGLDFVDFFLAQHPKARGLSDPQAVLVAGQPGDLAVAPHRVLQRELDDRRPDPVAGPASATGPAPTGRPGGGRDGRSRCARAA